MKTYKNYKPVVASFLYQILKGGWKIAGVIDCDCGVTKLMDKNNTEAKKIALSEILSGDDSTITFFKPNGEGKNMRVRALILLGNGADELVADWSYSSHRADMDFQNYWNKFCKIWEGKKVPTKVIS